MHRAINSLMETLMNNDNDLLLVYNNNMNIILQSNPINDLEIIVYIESTIVNIYFATELYSFP